MGKKRQHTASADESDSAAAEIIKIDPESDMVIVEEQQHKKKKKRKHDITDLDCETGGHMGTIVIDCENNSANTSNHQSSRQKKHRHRDHNETPDIDNDVTVVEVDGATSRSCNYTATSHAR